MFELPTSLFAMPFFCGLFFMLVGIIMYNFPPKKVNYFYGYRTESSMKSLPRWHFAQKYAAKALALLGAFFILISCLGFFIKLTPKQESYFGMLLFFASIALLIYFVERAIKKKFLYEDQ
ncbi:SdpI family protein [Flavobacterium agricola]|uniref:SdpI family protein n=1 Tax=Flavobacterium agricola TaxID=2870839 RepID=A0ABY6LW29_9FLAO|nr:SdpI family protein [Flavobacterium agricola]UYW00389.1 SdpI family protein [Flavobacterium agricola]